MQIYHTKRYDLFRGRKGARPVDDEIIGNFKQGFADAGNMRKKAMIATLSPVFVDEDLTIIEGQYIFCICVAIDVPVPYVIIEHRKTLDSQRYSYQATSWGWVEFIRSRLRKKV